MNKDKPHTQPVRPAGDELFRLMVESATDYAVFATDPSGLILSWNRGVGLLLGYEEAEWVGRDASIIFTPEDKECRADVLEMETAAREGRAADDRWHVRSDGTRFWANGVLMPLFGRDGSLLGFTKILRDETTAREREELLRDKRDLLAATLDSLPGIFYLFDSTGRFLRWNKNFERVTGYSAEEIERMTPLDLFEGEGRRHIEERIAEVFTTGRSSAEAELVTKAGARIPYHFTGSRFTFKGVECLVGMGTDITERRAAEEHLRESEEQFRTLADTIPQLAWMADAEGSIFWYNRRWYDYTGTTFEEMKGWGWQAVHHPEEVEGVTERFRRAVESGEPWEDTFPLRSKEGEYRWFLSRALPIRDAAGNVVRWFGTNTDVEELRQARQSAEEANRTKDEFLATLSHELRTPLTAILGWSRMLATSQLQEADTARALESIERNARAQVRLIDDILDVSRIVTGKLRLDIRPTDLGAVVEEAVESARPAAEAKGVGLRLVLDAGPRVVSGDADRLRQVVWNLLTNAVKFTPEGGRVEVRLDLAGSHVRVVVSDTGRGISPEVLPHVFERFRQADSSTTREHGGIGLGLAIVRHLVEMHGGTARAESPGEGRGATFTVELPLMNVIGERRSRAPQEAKPGPPASAGEKELPCPPELERIRVLMVDDDDEALSLFSAVLESCGARVTAVKSAQEALDEIKRNRFDVLVCDIGMPVEDGYQLIRKVRRLPKERGGQVAAAAITAYARAEDRMKVLRAGFQMHVAKPVEPAELVAIVASLAGRHGEA